MAVSGAVAEWLGRGLQSLVQRFESARRLLPEPRHDADLKARVATISRRPSSTNSTRHDPSRPDTSTRQRRPFSVARLALLPHA
jgi:hypothetical protein